jgi:5-methylcytosine-specific restriction protein A
MTSSEELCPLCKRVMVHCSGHHFVPKCRGGKETNTICSDCHRAIHSLFSNKELESKYNTIEALLEDDRFRKTVAFLAKQDPNRRYKTVRARDQKKRGRNG